MLLEEVLFHEANVLIENAKNLNPILYQVVDLIVDNARNNRYVLVGGVGKCYAVSIKSAETFCSLNIPSIPVDFFCTLHGDMGSITPNSLLISLSKSGETPEVLATLKGAAIKGAKLVSITCKENSTAGKLAKENNGLDIVLMCPNESCYLGLAPTSSTILFSSITNALAVVASEKLGISKETFLLNHSSGSLAEKIKKELEDEQVKSQ